MRSNRRSLRLEPLENRNLLSVSMPASITGVAFYDQAGNGTLTASDPRLAGVTVELLRRKATGEPKYLGRHHYDQCLGSLQLHRPFGGDLFRRADAGRRLCPAHGAELVTVNITSNNLQGTAGVVIDSFSTTTQSATAAYPSGTTGDSYASATDAVGGGRDMFVQLTSVHGSVTLGADSTTPDALDFTTGPGAVGIGQVTWQGQATGAYATAPGLMRNPTGLNHLDLTSSGAATGIELTVGASRAATATLKIYTDANDWSSATIIFQTRATARPLKRCMCPLRTSPPAAGTGADFTNVGAIQLQITGPAATEGQVADIGAVGPTDFAENFANVAQTDLAIVKGASPSPVVAGQQLTYTLTTTNNGPSNATGVVVSDTLPAGVSYTSVTTTQGTASFANGVVTANLGNLADGATATTTIIVTVDAATTGSIVNTATVTGNQTDPNLTNNTSTVTTPINAEADLAILKSGSPNPVDAGNTLTYTLTATNNGPSNATGVTVVDTLPAGVTYASSTTTQGSASDSGQTVTINLGGLASGATATSTIVVNVGASTVGDITNTATISGNQPDPNLANNTATATTLVIQPIHNVVIPQADLAIVKTASPTSVYLCGLLTYTLAVTNWGGSAATGVTVTDVLPTNVTFVSDSTSQGSISYYQRHCHCRPGVDG